MSYRDHDVFWAGGFLYDRATRSIFLHKRDGNTPASPNKWAFFGGRSEPGESDIDCFVREMNEEIGLRIQFAEVKRLREYMNTDANQYRVVFYVEKAVPVEQLVLGEGEGFAWIKLSDVAGFDLANRTRDDIEYFLEQRLD